MAGSASLGEPYAHSRLAQGRDRVGRRHHEQVAGPGRAGDVDLRAHRVDDHRDLDDVLAGGAVVALDPRLQADGVLALPRERAVAQDERRRGGERPPQAAVEVPAPLELATAGVAAVDVQGDRRQRLAGLAHERAADRGRRRDDHRAEGGLGALDQGRPAQAGIELVEHRVQRRELGVGQLAHHLRRAERGVDREEVVLRRGHVLDPQVVEGEAGEAGHVDRLQAHAEQRQRQVEHGRQHGLELLPGLGDELVVEHGDVDVRRLEADQDRLDLGRLARHLGELEVDADVEGERHRERAGVALVDEAVEVDLEVLEVDGHRRRRHRVVADLEVDGLLRPGHQQHRLVALAELTERRDQQADGAELELVDEAGADAETQPARGHQVVAGEVERGLRHADREIVGRLGHADELRRGQQRERAAGRGRQRRRRRGEVGRRDRRHAVGRLAVEVGGAGRRVLVGVEPGDQAERHAAALQLHVAARDHAGLHEALGARRHAGHQAADVDHAGDAERVGQEALDQVVQGRGQQVDDELADEAVEQAVDQVGDVGHDAAAAEVEVGGVEAVDADQPQAELAVARLDLERDVGVEDDVVARQAEGAAEADADDLARQRDVGEGVELDAQVEALGVGDRHVHRVEVNADVAAGAGAAGVGDLRGRALVGRAVPGAGGEEAAAGRADRAAAQAEAARELIVDQGRDDLGELLEAGPGHADLAAALDRLIFGQPARRQRLRGAPTAVAAEAATGREREEQDRER